MNKSIKSITELFTTFLKILFFASAVTLLVKIIFVTTKFVWNLF